MKILQPFFATHFRVAFRIFQFKFGVEVIRCTALIIHRVPVSWWRVERRTFCELKIHSTRTYFRRSARVLRTRECVSTFNRFMEKKNMRYQNLWQKKSNNNKSSGVIQRRRVAVCGVRCRVKVKKMIVTTRRDKFLQFVAFSTCFFIRFSYFLVFSGFIPTTTIAVIRLSCRSLPPHLFFCHVYLQRFEKWKTRTK